MATNSLSSAADELTIQHSLRILFRRRWVAAVIAAVATATAIGISQVRTPKYTASAEVVIEAGTDNPLSTTAPAPRVDPLRDIQTEAEVMTSEAIRDKVAVSLKMLDPPLVSATPLINADAITLLVRTTNPKESARMANAYAQAYLAFKESATTEAFAETGQILKKQIAGLQSQIDADSAPGAAASEAGTSANRDALIAQQGLLQQQLDETQLEEGVAGPGAYVAVPATIPTSPSSPKPFLYGILGLAFGLFLGVGVAFFGDSLDGSLHSTDDVDRAVPRVAILGVVPPPGRDAEQAAAVARPQAGSAPTSFVAPGATAEAYRGLRTRIEFLVMDRSLGIILVTSPGTGDGKTTTIVNLAAVLAATGRRVCVVSTDLRRTGVERALAAAPGPGLVDVVAGDTPLSAAIQKVPMVANLYLLPAGPLPADPAAFLALGRTDGVLASLRTEFELVLLDSPPILAVADATVLAHRVEATILVVRVEHTTRHDLVRAHQALSDAGGQLFGVVVNGVPKHGREDSYPSASGTAKHGWWFGQKTRRSWRAGPDQMAGPEKGPSVEQAPISVRVEG